MRRATLFAFLVVLLSIGCGSSGGGGDGGTAGHGGIGGGTAGAGGAAGTGTPLSGCVDKVGATNTSPAVLNTPDGIYDTYGSFTLTAAGSGATATNVTLFRTDATGTNLASSGGHFDFGVWTTEIGAQNIPGNYVAHLFIATTPNPGPNDFLAFTGQLSVTLATGNNKFYFFADSDDMHGGTYGFGLNIWFGGATAASPGLSGFAAAPGSSLMVDSTTGCAPAYDGTCTVSPDRLATTSSPTVTLTSLTIIGVGGACVPADAGASD
jgi:hypothetical protein